MCDIVGLCNTSSILTLGRKNCVRVGYSVLVCTAQKTNYTIKTNNFMIIREVITPYCEKCAKHINTLLGKPEIFITTCVGCNQRCVNRVINFT